MIRAPSLTDAQLAALPTEEDAQLLMPTRCPQCNQRLSMIRWQLGVHRGVKLSPYCVDCNVRPGDTVLARVRMRMDET